MIIVKHRVEYFNSFAQYDSDGSECFELVTHHFVHTRADVYEFFGISIYAMCQQPMVCDVCVLGRRGLFPRHQIASNLRL